MTMQHIPNLLQFIDMTIAQNNPAGAQKTKELMMQFLQNDLFKQIVEDNEVPGLSEKVPEIQDPTPIEQQLNQALMQIQQLTQQLQQMQMLLGGGMPPGGPGGGGGGMPPQQGPGPGGPQLA
jgi:hypothetical protein